MKPLTNGIGSAVIDKRNRRKERNHFLLNYCAMPHSTTQLSPTQLLFNCTINTDLSQITIERTADTHQHLVNHDSFKNGDDERALTELKEPKHQK